MSDTENNINFYDLPEELQKRIFNSLVKSGVKLIIDKGIIQEWDWFIEMNKRVKNLLSRNGYRNIQRLDLWGISQIVSEEGMYKTQYYRELSFEELFAEKRLGCIYTDYCYVDVHWGPVEGKLDLIMERIIMYNWASELKFVARAYEKTPYELRRDIEEYYVKMQERIKNDNTRSPETIAANLEELGEKYNRLEMELDKWAPKYPKLENIDLDKIPPGQSVCFEMDGKIVNYTPKQKSEENQDQPIKQSKENKYTFKDFVLDSIDPNPNTEPRPVRDNWRWNAATMIIVWLRIMIGMFVIFWIISCVAKSCREEIIKSASVDELHGIQEEDQL